LKDVAVLFLFHRSEFYLLDAVAGQLSLIDIFKNMIFPTLKETLKQTLSRCPTCQIEVPAEVWKTTGTPAKVYLSRSCPDHGEATACIASDARFYWLAKGNPSNACGASCACSADPAGVTGTLGRNADASVPEVEVLSTCLALIEIVDSCNLACPTCFADSPVGAAGDRLKYHSLTSLQSRIQGVVDRKGKIEILQLSGGEPTLHPQLFELIDWIHQHPQIDYCLVNTNAVRIAKEDAFLEELGKRARLGHFQLYLQFDGPQEAGQRDLRGADLRDMKRTAMERCDRVGIPFTLAMTVMHENLPYLWDTIETGLNYGVCRGISFQPMFLTGRTIESTGERLNTADIILGAVEQSSGKLRYEDFTPLPCGDPNCATIGYLLRTPIGTRSISEFIDFASVQGFLRDKVNYELSDLIQCGCENTELGDILHRFEMTEKDTFRLFIKPFMDAWTWDQDRIDRCCTHVIRQDGTLDSFCRYYAAGGGK
jgi:7,8-dihydro-6-hydroxymethylpterin dimethyltransferase